MSHQPNSRENLIHNNIVVKFSRYSNCIYSRLKASYSYKHQMMKIMIVAICCMKSHLTVMKFFLHTLFTTFCNFFSYLHVWTCFFRLIRRQMRHFTWNFLNWSWCKMKWFVNCHVRYALLINVTLLWFF